MSRKLLIPSIAGAFSLVTSITPPAIPRFVGFDLSNAAQAATNLHSSKSNKHKLGKKPGQSGPANIAVSDPGAEGSKPAKPKAK